MLDVDEYERYEAPSLIKWKKLSLEQQLKTVQELSEKYKDKLDVIKVKNQSIEVSLIMEKNEVYDYLVEYEAYIRKALGEFPVIILLKDRADENKKRK